MADLTGLFNTTLGRLGVGQVVASPTENSHPAKTCNRFYAQCRQEVLRAFPWGFALKAEPLALVAGQEFPGWGYVYQYPNGCLNVRAVADEGGIRGLRSLTLSCDPQQWPMYRRIQQPWQKAIKDDGASQVLLTDQEDAWGFYTLDVTNTGAWDVDFYSVLAWRLAMDVGGPLQARRDLIDSAEARYSAWLSAAAANQLNEQKDDRPADSPSISCRY
jgi:hypothetical protein